MDCPFNIALFKVLLEVFLYKNFVFKNLNYYYLPDLETKRILQDAFCF